MMTLLKDGMDPTQRAWSEKKMMIILDREMGDSLNLLHYFGFCVFRQGRF
jgi:hypothetical protein